MHVPRLLKDELGGGKKEFSLADGKFQSIHQPSVSMFLSTYHLSTINQFQEEILSISRMLRLFSAAQIVRASCFTSSTLSVRTRATAWARWPSGRARLSVRIRVLLNYLICPTLTLTSVPKCLSKGVLLQVYPLHDNDCLEELQRVWVKQLFGAQPLGTRII